MTVNDNILQCGSWRVKHRVSHCVSHHCQGRILSSFVELVLFLSLSLPHLYVFLSFSPRCLFFRCIYVFIYFSSVFAFFFTLFSFRLLVPTFLSAYVYTSAYPCVSVPICNVCLFLLLLSLSGLLHFFFLLYCVFATCLPLFLFFFVYLSLHFTGWVSVQIRKMAKKTYNKAKANVSWVRLMLNNSLRLINCLPLCLGLTFVWM